MSGGRHRTGRIGLARERRGDVAGRRRPGRPAPQRSSVPRSLMFKKMGVVTVGVAAGLMVAAPFASATECHDDSEHHSSHERSGDSDCNVTGGRPRPTAASTATRRWATSSRRRPSAAPTSATSSATGSSTTTSAATTSPSACSDERSRGPRRARPLRSGGRARRVPRPVADPGAGPRLQHPVSVRLRDVGGPTWSSPHPPG